MLAYLQKNVFKLNGVLDPKDGGSIFLRILNHTQLVSETVIAIWYHLVNSLTSSGAALIAQGKLTDWRLF